MSWLLEKEVNRELPDEWGGKVPTEVFIGESRRIVDDAKKEGLTLRILGGLAIAMHCQNESDFAKRLNRTGTGVVEGQEYSDIDFVAYRKQRDKLKNFFSKIGYVKRRATLLPPLLNAKYTITRKAGSTSTCSSTSCSWRTTRLVSVGGLSWITRR